MIEQQDSKIGEDKLALKALPAPPQEDFQPPRSLKYGEKLIKRELKAIKKQMRSRPYKAIMGPRQAYDDDAQGYSSDEPQFGNAFMTQYPNQPTGKSIVDKNDLKDEDLRIDMPARARKHKKSAALKRNEKNLARCLNYLGIKDRYMLDHFYPEFHAALEKKIEQKIRQDEIN